MTDNISPPKHPRELYRKLSLEAYKNAKRFIDEADLLYKRKSFGHSYALAVLGFEEWVKSIVGSMLLIGYSKFEDDDVKNCFKYHTWKHGVGLEWFYMFYEMSWWEIIENKEEIIIKCDEVVKGKKSFEKYQKEFFEFVKKDNSEASKDLLKLLEIIDQYNENNKIIEDRKQQGLYVDFKKNRLSTPDALRKIKIEETLETYRWIIESTSKWMEELKKRNIHDKKLKKLFKEGKMLRDFEDKLNEMRNKDKSK